ncbi:MAG TPA: S8 family serine peptidase [Phycisphaerae bacterium]|nr:S8 family serine peptidase [Phycisphaerae bacterium]
MLLSADVNHDGRLDAAEKLDGVEAAVKGTIMRRIPLRPGQRALRVQLHPGKAVADAIAENWGRGDARIVAVEPNYVVRILTTPNDPRFSEMWSLSNTGQTGGVSDADIDAPEAWDITTGSTPAIVAVVDTGIDYLHPDLVDNMWKNPGETGGGKETNGIDDDGNGYVDDVHGYDFFQNDSDPSDAHSHGTHVAGTIGAHGNNGLGVTGVNWQCRLMACRFLNAGGSGSTADAIEAINYAVANGAKVLNNSWGGGGYSASLEAAIANARDQGVLFVAAAGNAASDIDTVPTYPASYNVSNIIAVAATTNTDSLASFSNFGDLSVHLGAPGVSVLSSIPNYATLFSEDFQGVSPPTIGSSFVMDGPANRWGTVQNNIGFAGNKAARGDWANASPYLGGSEGSIVTTTMDTRGLRGLALQFSYRYQIGSTDALSADVWDGTTWRTVFTRNSSNLQSFYYFTRIDIPESYRNAAMKVRFRWMTDLSDNNYYGAEIDDVRVVCMGSNYANSYSLFSGTSMACPHVAGVAALAWGNNPGLSLASLKDRIVATGDAIPALAGKTISGRRLNAYNALQTAGLTVTSPNGGENWTVGTTHPITWSSFGGGPTVDVDLLKDGIFHSNLTNDAPNTGSFSWNIPAGLTTASDYRVRITDGTITDQSDANFALAASGCTVPPPVPANPTPVDEAVAVALDGNLTWNAGGGSGFCVVVPNANTNSEGDSNNAYPFSSGVFPSQRYQQIYDASQFPEAGLITAIRFRPDDTHGNAFTNAAVQAQISLGYSARPVANPSTTFSDNIGPGTVQVFNGTLTLSSADSGGPPRSVDIVVDVEDQFFYDPALGPLLLDIRVLNSPVTTFFDADGEFSGQTATTRIFSISTASDLTGGTDMYPYGLVTMFCFNGGAPLSMGPLIAHPRTELEAEPVAFEFDPATGVAWPDRGARNGNTAASMRGKPFVVDSAPVLDGMRRTSAEILAVRSEFKRDLGSSESEGSRAIRVPPSEPASAPSMHPPAPRPAAPARGGTTVLDAVQRGWWMNDGFHDSTNNNTFTGQDGGGADIFNSYFSFDLSGVGTVASATLRLELENYYGPDPSESVTVHDVSTPAATLEASGTNVAIFNDLQTGSVYATFTARASDVGTILDIPLSAAAINDINAAGGYFSVGLHCDQITLPSGDEGVRFSQSDEPRVHQLVLEAGSSCPATYDVLFGTSNPPTTVLCNDVAGTTCDPGALVAGTRYYWQVVATNAIGSTTGPVWSFTTAQPCTSPPVPADPNPSDGATDVPTNSELGWNMATRLFGERNDADHLALAAVSRPESLQFGASPSVGRFPAEAFEGHEGVTVQILAFRGHSDNSASGEYENTLNAIAQFFAAFAVTPTVTESASGLAMELAGKNVFLVPEQEFWTAGAMAAWGTSIATVMQNFAANGGRVIVTDYNFGDEFVNATGLMTVGANTSLSWMTQPCTVVQPGHAVMAGVPNPFNVMNGLSSFAGVTNGTVLATLNSTGSPSVIAREFGAGGIVIMAWDYFSYNTDMARIVANAVQWPESGHCSTTYDVLFGTSNPPMTLVCDDATTPTCDPGPLAAGTTYYWQVVATNSVGSAAGPVWSFTTEQHIDFEFALVVLTAPSLSDRGPLPASLGVCINKGETFLVELWATDSGAINTGVVCVFADLLYPASQLSVVGISAAPLFAQFSSGTDLTGRIDELGGCGLPNNGVGVGEWARVAIVEFRANECLDPSDVCLEPAVLESSAYGRGTVPISAIQHDCQPLCIDESCVYDLSGDGCINAVDLGLFAACWSCVNTSPCWTNSQCQEKDFDCSGLVAAGDLGWFATAWAKCCSDSSISYSACRPRCSGGASSVDVQGGASEAAPGVDNASAVGLGTVDLAVRLSLQPGAEDETAGPLPPGLSGPLEAGQRVFAEVWIRHRFDASQGITAAFVDVTASTSNFALVGVEPGRIFTMLSNPVIDAEHGLVHSVGGATMEPHHADNKWSRLALVELEVKRRVVRPKVTARPIQGEAVSGYGLGLIPTDRVKLVTLVDVEPTPQ